MLTEVEVLQLHIWLQSTLMRALDNIGITDLQKNMSFKRAVNPEVLPGSWRRV